jgi:A/G-specific adenine glycosylase
VLNEALMELGAMVCTPRSPRCEACPVARECQARRLACAEQIPPPKARARRARVHHHCVVVRRGRSILLERRPSPGLWAGLWQPPCVEAERELSAAEILRDLRARGLRVLSLRRRDSFEYLTTHRRVTFHVFSGETRSRRGSWHTVEERRDVPMSNAHRRVIALAVP